MTTVRSPLRCYTADVDSNCNAALHPRAAEGLRLFNAQKYFEAHEELETAWLEEMGKVRDLYRGILQTAVVFLHISRGNYNGAVKVYERSQKWLADFPDVCRGINVGRLKVDAKTIMDELQGLAKENIREFQIASFPQIEWTDKRVWYCDKCGSQMFERNCKVSCPNCGNRFDCSDLNIYFDP